MKNRQSGFTLIEMLVAMAIFSSLIAVLMVGYRQGLLLWDKGQRSSYVRLDQEFRYRLLDTMFAQAVVADDVYKQGLFAPFFHGSKQSIRMLSSAPVMDATGRVRPVELVAAQVEDGSWILRYREAERHSDPGRGLRWHDQWVNLLDSLQSVSFAFEAYAYPAPNELDPNWMSDEEKLRYRDAPEWLEIYDCRIMWKYPRRVMISFVDQDDEEHHWLFTPPNRSDAWSMSVYVDE